MKNIKNIRNSLERLKGEKTALLKKKKKKQAKLKRINKHIKATEQARAFLQQISKQTQEQVSLQLSGIVSTAMSAVFDDPYDIKISFIERRGKVEADIFFIQNGVEMQPKDATGGGAVDLAALALRLSCWAIQKHRTRNTLILDEPMKWLKGDDLPQKGSQIIKEISEQMRLQIIMVSHAQELIDCADKIFNIKIKNGVSKKSS